MASVGVRNDHLSRMLGMLAPQVDAQFGDVEVVIYWDNFEAGLGAARQALLDDARGRWVSFVDDDDEVPGYFVDKVMGALATDPDYVGWRQQLYVDGRADKPTFHSLRHDRWWDDRYGYYRHVSHLNPIRTDMARLGRFDRRVPEDADWAEQVHARISRRPNLREVFIDEVMYLYRYSADTSLWTRPRDELRALPHPDTPPELPSPQFRYLRP